MSFHSPILSALYKLRRRPEPCLAPPMSAEDPCALIEFLRANLPELAEELADLAGLGAGSQEQAVNRLPFGTRLLLEVYGVVETVGESRHLIVTSAGTHLIDAAVIASVEDLYAG